MAKVMIIEDDLIHNRLICDIVEALGHRPLNFYEVDPAKEGLIRETPDLFVIDMQIRDSMNASKTFIRYLSKNKKYKRIPIIIISAYVTKNGIHEEFPFIDLENVIEKPAKTETIIKRIECCININ